MKLSWKWIILTLLVILTLVAISYGGSGYKMARDWILADQAVIQKDLEDEVSKLDKERDFYLKQIAQLQQERTLLNDKYQKLKGKYDQLEAQMVAIIVPTNPDDLVLAFRKRGFKSTNLLRSR